MTAIVSSVGVVVDGDNIPWHVSHLRRAPPDSTREHADVDASSELGEASDDEDDELDAQSRPDATAEEVAGGSGRERLLSARVREPPSRWADKYHDYY